MTEDHTGTGGPAGRRSEQEQFLPYVPYHKRQVGDVDPQTSPERFAVADLRKEIAGLRLLNKRLGWHPLRAHSIERLQTHIAERATRHDHQVCAREEDQPAEARETVTVHLAIAPNGGSNAYADGFWCRDCDGTFDPHHRGVVPCRNAAAHAANTAQAWGPGARVETAEVPAATVEEVVAAARRKIQPESGSFIATGDAADAEQQLQREGRCSYQTAYGDPASGLRYCRHPADDDLYATDSEGLCTRHGRQVAGIEDPEINVGDRVRDTDPDADPDRLGTVTAADNSGYMVRWDGQDTAYEADYGDLEPVDDPAPAPAGEGPGHCGAPSGPGGAAAAGGEVTGEITGLAGAVEFTAGMARRIDQGVSEVELAAAGLRDGGVSGPALEALSQAGEALTQAAAAFRAAHTALSGDLAVRDAYHAHTGAGTREFLTQT